MNRRSIAAFLSVLVAGLLAPAGAGAVTCDSEGEAGSEYLQGVNCRVTAIDGHPRKYIVYVPRGPRHDPVASAPLC